MKAKPLTRAAPQGYGGVFTLARNKKPPARDLLPQACAGVGWCAEKDAKNSFRM